MKMLARATVWTLIGVGLALLPAEPVEAFNSYPPGAPHDQITRAACLASGWSRKAASQACAAVRRPDRAESRWWPSWSPSTWLRFRPNDAYRPTHHFDRPMGVSDLDAFSAGAQYARAMVSLAAQRATARDRAGAMSALGSGLHAVQDLHSHSNLVDLSSGAVDSVEQAIWEPSAAVPAALRLTGYDAKARDPERPPGDAYSHRDFAKDGPNKNKESKKQIAGQSKYMTAKALAIEASKALMRRVQKQCAAAEWRSLSQ